jgi:hypothetical protein
MSQLIVTEISDLGGDAGFVCRSAGRIGIFRLRQTLFCVVPSALLLFFDGSSRSYDLIIAPDRH